MKRAAGAGGEIVEVEGGHIIRSTGKKDRHSKVYTAKGPRDRRVRLSAHTAIQFYDVQDRLGYDRPSKAVDWLIKKAKDAIDKLDELPPWNPNSIVNDGNNRSNNLPTSTTVADNIGPELQQEFQLQRQLQENNVQRGGNPSSYNMMQEPHHESLGDTMKSFFPMNSGTSLMNFQNYPHEIMPRTGSIQNEDLGLSLHSTTTFHQDHNNSNHRVNNSHHHNDQLALFSSSQNFEANYPRMGGWILPHHQQIFYSQSGSSNIFPQREPLQSNFSQLIHHAWEAERSSMNNVHQIADRNFTTDFQIPARIHGEHHEQPPSGSPSSHH